MEEDLHERLRALWADSYTQSRPGQGFALSPPRWRSLVVSTFSNTESCRRLVTVRLKEHHEDWITGRTYIDMSPLWETDETEEEVTPAA